MSEQASVDSNMTPEKRVAMRLIMALCGVYVIPGAIQGTISLITHSATDDYKSFILNFPSASHLLWEAIAKRGSDCLQTLGELTLAMLLAWGWGLSWKGAGLVRFRPRRDIPISLLIPIAGLTLDVIEASLANNPAGSIVSQLGHFRITLTQSPLSLSCMILVWLSLSSASQELVFRGLLIPALRKLSGSTALAVIVSSLLFTSIHIYQGWAILPVHFVFGLVTSWTFLKTGSLWPGIIGHTMVNLFYFL